MATEIEPSASKDGKVSYFSLFKTAGADWVEDKAAKLAAALAFYTMLSIAPLLIISIKICGLFGQSASTRDQVSWYVKSNVSEDAAKALEPIFKQASEPGAGFFATVVSLVILLLSASGVFGELQDSLNTIWEVKPRPNQSILTTIRERFFSMTLVFGVTFLLLVSLIASTVLAALTNKLGLGQGVLLKGVNLLASLVMITGLFAMIFHYLPDVRMSWRSTWAGAVLTAFLFTVGKFLLGWYLGQASTTSVYGTAGSLVALLLWVYYSSQIVFFGAEFTQAWARAHGDGIVPTANAVRVTETERAQQGMVSPERMREHAASQPVGGQPSRRFAVPAPVRPPIPLRRAPNVGVSVAIASAGLAVGALAGALGAKRLKQIPPVGLAKRRMTQDTLDERIKAIESKIARHRGRLA